MLSICISKHDVAGEAPEALTALETQVQQWMQSNVNSIYLEDEAGANVHLRIEDENTIFIGIRHPCLPKSRAVESYHTVDVANSETIHDVLDSAITFIRSLSINAPEGPQFTVEFFKIVKNQDGKSKDDTQCSFKPEGPNLLCDGIVKVTTSKEVSYGINIRNATDKNLYCHPILYYDCGDLSVESQPQREVELPANGILGFAQSGYIPWQFYLRDGQTTDTGFIKIFVTSSPVTVPETLQENPFAKFDVKRDGLSKGALYDSLVATITFVVDQIPPDGCTLQDELPVFAS
ncbi:unnamed protein product [Peniophora sp. CBMAI 1063]|nr:unnamed protein product [Peniophora sp. CBMAI 1063]